MEAFLAPSRPVNQYFGVYPGIVIDNVDPEKRYRVKVKFPWMMESDAKYVDVADKEDMPSTWCRITGAMNGTVAHGGGLADELRGEFFLPEVDDEVLVTFLFGSFREPIIIGNLYNGMDQPFWNNKESKGVQIAEKNCLRGWRSRSGHMIAFVDKGEGDTDKIVMQANVKDDNVYDQPGLGGQTNAEKAMGGQVTVDVPDGTTGSHMLSLDNTSGSEHVLLSDKKGEVLIKFDTVEQTMVLYAKKDMVIHAKENLFIKCKSLKMETEKDCEMEWGTTWKAKSGSTTDFEAGGTMTLKGGPDIQLNP
ncbi:MAG: hypothetical protein ACI9WU_002692 [Myxococcota bacterium]|jgi:hypothetical protein